MDYFFSARLQRDPDGGFLVTFPDVPEAITAGDTRAGALENGAEALGLALRGYLADGRPLPRPEAKGRSFVPVAIAAEDALKLALIDAFQRSGLSKSAFARRMGKAESEARRILDPDHPTKLATMHDALTTLGKSVVISVRDAA